MKHEWKDFFLETVEKRYFEIKSKNSRFSVRRFADMAKVSPGTMSMILSRSEQWSLTAERALTVLQNVKVDSEKVNIFAIMCTPKCADTASALPLRDEEIFLSNPYYMPICLSFSLGTPPSLKDMASALKLSEERIQEIIQDLLQRGYLQIQDGRITKGTPKQLASGDGPSSELVRKHHLNNLEAVREALLNSPAETRDISGLILTGSSQQFEAVKEEIRQFYARVHAIMNSTNSSDDIFRLFVGFVPLRMNSEPQKENLL